MSRTLKLIIIILAAVVVVAVAAAGTADYSYSRLESTSGSITITPEFNLSLASGLLAAESLFQRDPLQAAAALITGVKIEGTVDLHNNSLVPLYLPAMTNRITIAGQSLPQPLTTPSLWIPPRSVRSQPLDLFVNESALPTIALEALASGGTIEIRIDSQISVGPFRVSRETSGPVNVLHPLNSQFPGLGTGK